MSELEASLAEARWAAGTAAEEQEIETAASAELQSAQLEAQKVRAAAAESSALEEKQRGGVQELEKQVGYSSRRLRLSSTLSRLALHPLPKLDRIKYGSIS